MELEEAAAKLESLVSYGNDAYEELMLIREKGRKGISEKEVERALVYHHGFFSYVDELITWKDFSLPDPKSYGVHAEHWLQNERGRMSSLVSILGLPTGVASALIGEPFIPFAIAGALGIFGNGFCKHKAKQLSDKEDAKLFMWDLASYYAYGKYFNEKIRYKSIESSINDYLQLEEFIGIGSITDSIIEVANFKKCYIDVIKAIEKSKKRSISPWSPGLMAPIKSERESLSIKHMVEAYKQAEPYRELNTQ